MFIWLNLPIYVHGMSFIFDIFKCHLKEPIFFNRNCMSFFFLLFEVKCMIALFDIWLLTALMPHPFLLPLYLTSGQADKKPTAPSFGTCWNLKLYKPLSVYKNTHLGSPPPPATIIQHDLLSPLSSYFPIS